MKTDVVDAISEGETEKSRATVGVKTDVVDAMIGVDTLSLIAGVNRLVVVAMTEGASLNWTDGVKTLVVEAMIGGDTEKGATPAPRTWR